MKYNYRSRSKFASFEKQVKILKKKVKNNIFIGWPNITYSKKENDGLIEHIRRHMDIVVPLTVDIDEFHAYLEKINYQEKYPHYYSFNFHEKTFEHFVAFKLLDLKKEDRFIDIAAEYSPHSEEFSRLTGCSGYKQDIMFKPGIHDRQIGGDASGIPVDDHFFQGALAACSIEHFEKDADIRFMKEITRVLSTGGKVVIIPLYLHEKPFCVTDPRYSLPGKVRFDPNIDIHCVKEYQNRHGRFYSPQTLFERLITPNLERMNFTVYFIENFKEIHDSIYCRFVLLGEKKETL